MRCLVMTAMVAVAVATAAPAWEETYSLGGTADTRDGMATVDGNGFVAAGRHISGVKRPFLVRVDVSGNLLWYEIYPSYTLYDAAWSVTSLAEGGFLLGGKAQPQYGGQSDDILVIKTDANGQELWHNIIDLEGTVGGENGFDRLWDTLELSSGDLVGCGTVTIRDTAKHDAGLVKMDSSGNLLWARNYGPENTTEVARACDQTSDGGFVLAGYYGYDGAELKSQMYVVRTDASGNEVWSATFGDPNLWHNARWVAQTPDGGFLVAGRAGEPYSGTDAWVLKLSASGTLLWDVVVGGDYQEWLDGGEVTADGGAILVGFTQSFSSDPGSSSSNADAWVVQLDPDGNTVWSETFGIPGTGEGFADIDNLGTPGEYIAAGSRGSDVYMVSLSGLFPTVCDGIGDDTWNGCRANGCAVCEEKLVGYDCYFENHPQCVLNTTCAGRFFDCDAACPEPTEADRCVCDGIGDGTWDGCRGNGCAVCAEKVVPYDCYFENHPDCVLNETCAGWFFDCDRACPPPSEYDFCEVCDGIGDGIWRGCRGNGCAVCEEKLGGYDCYFVNHPQCDLNTTCAGSFYYCDAACPEPTAEDQCVCDGVGDGIWRGCRGNGCAVCAEMLEGYDCYFERHPQCVLNTTCAGQFYYCDAACPPPTEADRCPPPLREPLPLIK